MGGFSGALESIPLPVQNCLLVLCDLNSSPTRPGPWEGPRTAVTLEGPSGPPPRRLRRTEAPAVGAALRVGAALGGLVLHRLPHVIWVPRSLPGLLVPLICCVSWCHPVPDRKDCVHHPVSTAALPGS